MAKINWIPYQTKNGKKPVIEFISKLTKMDRAKAVRILEFIATNGIEVGMPYLKLFLQEKIGEIRFRGRDHLYRVFFFHWTGEDFILTHGFIKKTQKTPQIEIERARKYKKD